MAESLAKLVTREDVLNGIEHGNVAPTTLIASTKYDVLILGKLYPPKEVIRLAARYKGLDPSKYALNGGAPTNDYLIKMGFPIFDKEGNHLGGGDTGVVWKLGTRWGRGNPNFNELLKREKIVITFEKHTFNLGDLVAITDGHTVHSVARVNDNMQTFPDSPYAHLEKEFRELKVDWGDWILVAKATIYDLATEEQFEYKLEAGIRQIRQEEVKKRVTELWFQKEYIRAKRSSDTKKSTNVYANPYNTYDNEVMPKLDVTVLSKTFAELIRNLKNSPGQMLGVFGQWGRGKTYFMSQVENELNLTHHEKADNENKKNQFYYLKFHAWKYQDTEGVWAYLYQKIMELYLTHKNNELRKHGNFFQKRIFYPIAAKWNETRLLFRLNRIRNGIFDICLFTVLALLVICLAIYNPNFLEDFKYWKMFLLTGTVVPLLSFFNKIWKLGDKGKRLIKTYTHKPNFNKLLGVQAEIQEELKYILRAWMKTEFKKEDNNAEHLKNDQKRLLLFVDDIDRCHEERLIQVIDALRVMLEDDEISKRVIIISAIDEDILERAIQWKYRNFIKQDKNDARKDALVKEYMDKLFIACLKLPPLYEKEKNQIIDNYAEKIGVEEKSNNDEIIVDNNLNSNNPNQPDAESPSKSNDTTGTEEAEEINPKEISYVLKREELEKLKVAAKNINGNITPRQLRIFMYRYLLSRNIGQAFNDDVLNIEWCNFMMDKIVEKRNVKVLIPNEAVEKLNKAEESILESLNISDKLKYSTNKIIEIVAPY
ncbi:hypothetical protein IMCC3317_06790 [Kordia antarctica]|uniref:KAP NTPase domain-containing protein n=1 Tax=Kordia antarctica TaxID=1218801 RepID=A0A7L4ZF73_9FLAO|nr:P-loop NTPase fold protein [Kordia antarctica]QHI35333.1 hypothetical protein IMCC3317_06790 [Kordia antarctica]